jgi:hypothetical protein
VARNRLGLHCRSGSGKEFLRKLYLFGDAIRSHPIPYTFVYRTAANAPQQQVELGINLPDTFVQQSAPPGNGVRERAVPSMHVKADKMITATQSYDMQLLRQLKCQSAHREAVAEPSPSATQVDLTRRLTIHVHL